MLDSGFRGELENADTPVAFRLNTESEAIGVAEDVSDAFQGGTEFELRGRGTNGEGDSRKGEEILGIGGRVVTGQYADRGELRVSREG